MKLFLSYLDPGTGSVFLSFILASCVGAVSLYWGKIKRLLGFGKTSAPAADDKPSGQGKDEPHV